MHKTLLATAIGLALIGSAAAADPVTITTDNSTQTWTEENGKSPAFANQDVKGETGNETLLIEGAWKGGIHATAQDVTVSNLASLDIQINGLQQTDTGVNGLYASGGHTLTIQDVDSVSVVTSNLTNSQAPIPVHAMGGTIRVNAAGDITLQGETTVISSQLSGTSSGLVDLTAGGTLSIKSNSTDKTAVTVMALQSSEVEGINAGMKLNAQNVKIEAGLDAVDVFDQDLNWNGAPGFSIRI